MADFINQDLLDLPDIKIQLSDEVEDAFPSGDIIPINGEIFLDNIPRLFPRWMLDMMKDGVKFDVLGNQASDMEVLSMKLYFDLNGYENAIQKYGDLAVFNNKLGWTQYFIDVDSYLNEGFFRLTTNPDVQQSRLLMSWEDSELIFRKTKFGTWIDFPWYMNSVKGSRKFNARMLADLYLKASSAKIELAKV